MKRYLAVYKLLDGTVAKTETYDTPLEAAANVNPKNEALDCYRVESVEASNHAE